MTSRLLSKAMAFVLAASITVGLGLALRRARGDESHHGGASSSGGAAYSASVTTTPSPVRPGQPATLDIQVHDAHRRLVTAYAPLHTRTMHLIAASQDLEDFHHVHPSLGSDGHLRTTLTFARPQPYSIFLEYDPQGGDQQLSRVRVTPLGSRAAVPHWNAADAFTGDAARSLVVGSTRVELVRLGATIRAGRAIRLMARVRDQGGGPARIKDYLGMPGHAILLSKDLSHFQHLHGERGGSGSHGGHGMGMTGAMAGMNHGSTPPMPAWTTSDDLGFDVTFPGSGLYKVFIQFERGSTVITAPFIVNVATAPAHGGASAHGPTHHP